MPPRMHIKDNSIIGKRIKLGMLSEVKEAKFHSIIADEVCDVSNKEQLSLCLRYIRDCHIKEMFVDSVEVERITGRELAGKICYYLTAWGLPLSNLRGQMLRRCFQHGRV